MTTGNGPRPLTARGIKSLKPGEWATDSAPRGAGTLQARGLLNGAISFYYRYTDSAGKRIRLPLGTGLDLADARRKTAELDRMYQSGARDLREKLDADRTEEKRQREIEAEAKAAEAVRKHATLGALLQCYVEHLKQLGRTSASSVDRAIQRHVKKAFPLLWSTPANDISTEDLVTLLARLTAKHKLREAAKLRSYLIAAYNVAIGARQDARASSELRELRVSSNPARDLIAIKDTSQPKERSLSVSELKAYWRHICELPDPQGALLRFHLLTGGQRVAQLARVTMDKIDTDVSTIRILDPKGRRPSPRKHDIPLIPEAMEALNGMGPRSGPFVFTLTNGRNGVSYTAVRKAIRKMVSTMQDKGELEKGPFTPGDIRRTVETRLAALSVSKDIRGQVQSHGLGGVQSRHYDRHDYLEEKRSALTALHDLVTG